MEVLARRWRLAATLAATLLASALVLSGSGAQADHFADDGFDTFAAQQVAAGWMHSCGVTGDGQVFCWGSNHFGQLGDGTFGNVRPIPRRIDGAFGGAAVRQVATGYEHTCALTTTGQVWCWGSNSRGQLGFAVSSLTAVVAPIQATPKRVDLPGTFVGLTTGYTHTCALRNDGQPYCWGANTAGQLGDGNMVDRPYPNRTLLTSVREISAGFNFTCAVTTDSAAWCWGANGDGQLGDGSTVARNERPVRVLEANGFNRTVTHLAAGENHACATLQNQAVYCWGNDASGQLGNDQASTDQRSPARVVFKGGATFTASNVSASAEHTCAWRDSDRKAWCWGNNWYGQLGDNTPYGQVVFQPDRPVWHLTLTSKPTGGIMQLHVGVYHTCSANENARAFCWGLNATGQLGDGTFVQHRQPAAIFSPPL